MLAMLRHVAAAAREAGVGPVWLATSEPTAARLAGELGLRLADDGGRPWNEGLAHAASGLPAADGVLFLAADLPQLTAAEIRELVRRAPDPGVGIARAHDGGTNALVLRPAAAIGTAVGAAGPAAVPADLARAARLPPVVGDLRGP